MNVLINNAGCWITLGFKNEFCPGLYLTDFYFDRFRLVAIRSWVIVDFRFLTFCAVFFCLFDKFSVRLVLFDACCQSLDHTCDQTLEFRRKNWSQNKSIFFKCYNVSISIGSGNFWTQKTIKMRVKNFFELNFVEVCWF